jgi:hypothetical protein
LISLRKYYFNPFLLFIYLFIYLFLLLYFIQEFNINKHSNPAITCITSKQLSDENKIPMLELLLPYVDWYEPDSKESNLLDYCIEKDFASVLQCMWELSTSRPESIPKINEPINLNQLFFREKVEMPFMNGLYPKVPIYVKRTRSFVEQYST